MYQKSILAAVAFTLAASTAYAQLIIYPAQGQSPEQQNKDEAECYTWAKGQTGYDPAQASQAVAPPPPPPQRAIGGERVRGAMRGAVGGAVIGEIVDDDAGKGASVGAVVGTMAGGARQRQTQAANQQAAAQQQQAAAQQQQAAAAQQQNFQKAYSACFEGRGYTVK